MAVRHPSGMNKPNADLYIHGPRRRRYSENRSIQSCNLTAKSLHEKHLYHS